MKKSWILCIVLIAAFGGALALEASSHREAPFITEHPKVDGTDFYLFNSYEAGRDGFVTLVADYLPLQDPFGGPNYFSIDPEAEYRIHVENDGDGVEDLTFIFRFAVGSPDIQIPVGDKMVSIPLLKAAPGPFVGDNFYELYTVGVVRGAMAPGKERRFLVNKQSGGLFFGKPFDNIGTKTFPDYAGYARGFIFDAEIPDCGAGRVFVGQRKDPFVVNLGETFDLVNLDNPLGPVNGESDDLAGKNVTAFALEVPKSCLVGNRGSVIGGWTTAALPRNRVLDPDPSFDQPALETGPFVQVSRLGMPLVNEVVIGLKDKNRFNASRPVDDAQFAHYVTHPTLPELLEILFGNAGVRAPNNFPRQDLVAAFVTGIEGLNELGFGEMIRLNTAIPAVPAVDQRHLGLLAGDTAGFPNGRRPGDDVVDIALRVVMGAVCHGFPGAFCFPDDAPSGALPFTDGALVDASHFDNSFPYLRSPLAGSPRP